LGEEFFWKKVKFLSIMMFWSNHLIFCISLWWQGLIKFFATDFTDFLNKSVRIRLIRDKKILLQDV